MVVRQIDDETKTLVYESNYQHLEDELQKLDLMIQLRIARLRLKTQAVRGVAADPHIAIAHQEVDGLLRQDEPHVADPAELIDMRNRLEMFQNRINERVTASTQSGVFLALPHLAHLFALSPLELQALIICIAPEMRRKYDKLYAYMQDDITRMKPSVDLILGLLCESETDGWKAVRYFSDRGALLRANILEKVDDPQSPSGSSDLAQFLRVDRRISNYILGNNSLDIRLDSFAKLFGSSPILDHVPIDETIKSKVLNLIQYQFTRRKCDNQRLVLYFYGPYGVGKRDLALGLCGHLGYQLLYIDTEVLLAHEADLDTLLQLAFREGLLMKAALFFDNIDVLRRGEVKLQAFMKKIADLVTQHGRLTFFAGETPWSGKEIFDQWAFQAVELPIPDVPLREITWREVLGRVGVESDPTWVTQLATQFRLTPGQIKAAGEFAESQAAMGGGCEIRINDLYKACRHQSNQSLAELAIKVEPRYSWEDIVLPPSKLEQLQEICYQVKNRYRMLSKWGFDRKLARGKGLIVLFTGQSGTGKTMAAEIIAHELQLDLYKIDLSRVVSKYIGETEKNMARIFDEAETSNAVLFFDEADAVIGKRTQVSDSHDRYANIETSYLLQRIEEYEGVVFMATNLRTNIDDAFMRRISLLVDFPSPDVESRNRQIWEVIP